MHTIKQYEVFLDHEDLFKIFDLKGALFNC